MPPEEEKANQEQGQQQGQGTPPQQEQEPVIKNPAAVLKTIEALREEVKALKATKSDGTQPTAIPPEVTAELDRLRKFANEKEQEEKDRQRKELEARGQYEALLRDAKNDAEKQISALKEQSKHLQTELGKRDSALSERDTILRDYRLRTSARDAFFAQGGRRGDESQGGDFYFNLVWENALKKNLNETEDGIQVVDGNSLLLDEEKREVDLNGLIRMRKLAYGFAFEGDPASSGSGKAPTGSGRPPAAKGKLVMPRTALSSRSEQISWARSNGIDPAKITQAIQTGEIEVGA